MQTTFKLLAKSQSDGAQTIDLSRYERARIHQLQVDLSATPAVGALQVAIKTPGAGDYVGIGEIDLVNGPLAADFEGFCESVRLTPVGFDAGKTYSAYLFCLQV